MLFTELNVRDVIFLIFYLGFTIIILCFCIKFYEPAVFRTYLIAGTHCAFLCILSIMQSNKLDFQLHKKFWHDYGSYKNLF